MTPSIATQPPVPPVPVEAAPADSEAARRALRVRLLRDLVSNGLYRIRIEELAERLVPVLRGR
jgi:hypothetical protein